MNGAVGSFTRQIMPRRRPPSIDWCRVVQHLARHQSGEGEVALRLGVDAGWLDSLANRNADPSYCDGEALLELWVDVTDLPLSEVPRKR